MGEAVENCNECVVCGDKVNGINLDLPTGQFAETIGDFFPALGKGISGLLDAVDISFEGRIKSMGIKLGLENVAKCNPSGPFSHFFSFGFTSCDLSN